MTYIPDPEERMEARVDNWLHDLKWNAKDGTIECVECRKRGKMSDMTTASADPSAPPVCRECCPESEEFMHVLADEKVASVSPSETVAGGGTPPQPETLGGTEGAGG